MADEERKSSKRSRFDQTEPDVKRTSRFDRRSRSPTSRASESQRSRSPLVSKTPFSPGAQSQKSPSDPAAAAGRLDHPLRPMAEEELTLHVSGRRSSNQCLDTSQERGTAC